MGVLTSVLSALPTSYLGVGDSPAPLKRGELTREGRDGETGQRKQALRARGKHLVHFQNRPTRFPRRASRPVSERKTGELRVALVTLPRGRDPGVLPTSAEHPKSAGNSGGGSLGTRRPLLTRRLKAAHYSIFHGSNSFRTLPSSSVFPFSSCFNQRPLDHNSPVEGRRGI